MTEVLRFVALGDSLTEGVGDPVGGAWRGWAELLSAGLAPDGTPVEFHNFAASGAQTSDVLARQMPQALALRPDIASVLVGVNDTLRRTFDIHAVAARLDHVYAAFTEQGAVLLTACLPDPGTMLGLPGLLGRPLARRQQAVNSVVHALSERYGAVHLHAAEGAWVADRSMWSADRLHPGERGHRILAARFHALLAADGRAQGTPPSPRRTARAHALGEPGVARHGGHGLGREAVHRPASPASHPRRGRAAPPGAWHQRPPGPAGVQLGGLGARGAGGRGTGGRGVRGGRRVR